MKRRKARVLVVDADLEFLEAVHAELEASGFETIAVPTAREGWEAVEYEGPDLVVLEVMLERHDAGFVLAKRIKTDPRFSGIPVLLCTAVCREGGLELDLEKDGYWLRADDLVEKPVAPAELAGRVRALLGKASA